MKHHCLTCGLVVFTIGGAWEGRKEAQPCRVAGRTAPSRRKKEQVSSIHPIWTLLGTYLGTVSTYTHTLTLTHTHSLSLSLSVPSLLPCPYCRRIVPWGQEELKGTVQYTWAVLYLLPVLGELMGAEPTADKPVPLSTPSYQSRRPTCSPPGSPAFSPKPAQHPSLSLPLPLYSVFCNPCFILGNTAPLLLVQPVPCLSNSLAFFFSSYGPSSHPPPNPWSSLLKRCE